MDENLSFCNSTDLLNQFNFSEYDYPGNDGPGPLPLDYVSAIKISVMFYSTLKIVTLEICLTKISLFYLYLLKICVINMVMSVLGNGAVVVAVFYNPALRSTINYYLVNLAIADVLIALCCMWPHLVNDLTKPAFVLGAFMCKFNAFAQSKSDCFPIFKLPPLS